MNNQTQMKKILKNKNEINKYLYRHKYINEPIEENIEQPSLPAPRQNLPEPSIQQGKGLN